MDEKECAANELHQILKDIARDRSRLNDLQIRAIREAERLEVWRYRGFPDLFSYLAATFGDASKSKRSLPN